MVVDVGVLTQQVEVTGCRRRLADGESVLGAQLQPAFDACRAVVRALPLETMGQQHHHTGLLVPFRLPGDNELVGNDLGSVGEVTELRLPQDQGVRSGYGVAILKTHGRVLTEQ